MARDATYYRRRDRISLLTRPETFIGDLSISFPSPSLLLLLIAKSLDFHLDPNVTGKLVQSLRYILLWRHIYLVGRLHNNLNPLLDLDF